MKTLTISLALFAIILPSNNLLRAQCAPPTAQADLDIANVRARIQCGGDMWWDAVTQIGPKYEVPIGSGKNSLFSGSLWMGGIDALNNLHVAAQTYRQNGSDFWPGPLDTTSASVSPATCLQYDRLWKINKQDVIDFIGGAPPTNDMLMWPGNGIGAQSHFLAPYVDVDSDGHYNAQIDYPDFGFTASPNCCSTLHGDQAIWWVINDAGNIHSETGGSPFGVEIQCQAFAYNIGDIDISNTTFYQYLLINRSVNTYNSTYFGIYADVDLGYDLDDYIGCDVTRSLGYAYNGDSVDADYGYPPAIGIDFLHSPTTDSCGISMQHFMYYNNDFTNTGNPVNTSDYYNYLKSVYRNGNHLTYSNTGIPCNYLFPGNSDHQWEYGTGGTCGNPAPPQADWDEVTSGDIPYDRRFLMSAGPFTFSPGAVHCITTAVVWAHDLSGPGPYYSVASLQAADDKAQLFFDNCFDVNVLGINQPENIQASLFPNPVNDLLEVQLKNIIPKANFSIYDVTGKIVKQVNIKQQQKFSIPCKDLSSGVYVYRIQLPDGKTSGGKFVKN